VSIGETLIPSFANCMLFIVDRLKCVPQDRLSRIAELTVDRLQDKSSHPRKNALHLLTTLMQYNPFGPTLSAVVYTNALQKLENNMVW
jgi:hypothetical protein